MYASPIESQKIFGSRPKSNDSFSLSKLTSHVMTQSEVKDYRTTIAMVSPLPVLTFLISVYFSFGDTNNPSLSK